MPVEVTRNAFMGSVRCRTMGKRIDPRVRAARPAAVPMPPPIRPPVKVALGWLALDVLDE